ncbi:MAG: hypothetical protein EA397_10265 [Deltaproteobacteria bacterium]|nr:MAG: hypothetical protein EA397_10265 [Deltaproteobacteria bacterium]
MRTVLRSSPLAKGLLALLALAASSVAFAQGPSMQERVDGVLSEREDPGCDKLFALGARGLVRDALIAAVQTELPPWAPLRAASCLTELAVHDEQAWETVQDLLQRPDQPGFVLAILDRAHALPVERAELVAQHSLERAQQVRALQRTVPTRLKASPYPSVRALAPDGKAVGNGD